jgi:hypothetical protein
MPADFCTLLRLLLTTEGFRQIYRASYMKLKLKSEKFINNRNSLINICVRLKSLICIEHVCVLY